MSRTATPLRNTTPTIYNVALTTADTQYSQALPTGTRKFRIYAVNSTKIKPHSAVLRYSYTSLGDGDWSGETYISIPAGNYDEDSGLDLSGKTLYFSSPTGSGIVIIKVWT